MSNKIKEVVHQTPLIENEEKLPQKARQVLIELDKINLDGGTQFRVSLDQAHIKRLADHLIEGQNLSPVTVFSDGNTFWLVDGFHRWHAHQECNLRMIRCEVLQGTQREAILFAVGANAKQKTMLSRTSADKQKAVLTLLQDPEWRSWSDSQIAKQCQVNQSTVSRIRTKLYGSSKGEKERIFINRYGKISRMHVGNIGQKVLRKQSAVSSRIKRRKDKLEKELAAIDLRERLELLSNLLIKNARGLTEEQEAALFDVLKEFQALVLKMSQEVPKAD